MQFEFLRWNFKKKGLHEEFPVIYQQKYKININKIKYTFCSAVKDTKIEIF